MKQTARVHRAEEGSYIRSERSLSDEVTGKSEVTLFVRRLNVTFHCEGEENDASSRRRRSIVAIHHRDYYSPKSKLMKSVLFTIERSI